VQSDLVVARHELAHDTSRNDSRSTSSSKIGARRFPREVTWYTAPSYSIRSGRAAGESSLNERWARPDPFLTFRNVVGCQIYRTLNPCAQVA
jgi:hypothetical protein